MSSTQFPRSRWLLKSGQYEPVVYQPVYQPAVYQMESPRADPFIYNRFDQPGDNIENRATNVRYPFAVPDVPGSDYVRCYRSAERFDLCEKLYGCCTDGCCPKDEWWMAGVYVLIAFVIAVVIIAIIVGVVCYQRSSSRKHKERMYYSSSGSAVGSQHPYGSDIGSHNAPIMGAPY